MSQVTKNNVQYQAWILNVSLQVGKCTPGWEPLYWVKISATMQWKYIRYLESL